MLDLLEGQVYIDLEVEIHLRARPFPEKLLHRFPVWASEVLEGGLSVEAVMMEVEETLLAVLDTRGEDRIVLRGADSARHIVIVAEVQNWTVLPPSQEAVDAMIERASALVEGEDDDDSQPA